MVRLHLPSVLHAESSLPVSRGKLPSPDKFSGANGTRHIAGWLETAVSQLHWSGAPREEWASAAASMLTGTAARDFPDLHPGIPLWEMSWEMFCEIMTRVYGRSDREPRARADLDALRQTGSVQEYTARFRQLIALITTQPPSKGDIIHRWLAGLTPDLQDKCFTRPDGYPWDNFDALTDFAVRQEVSLEMSRRASKLSRTVAVPKTAAGPSAGPSAGPRTNGNGQRKRKATDGGAASSPAKKGKLTPFGTTRETHDKRMRAGQCFYCGQKGHLLPACPHRAAGEAGEASPAGNVPQQKLDFVLGSKRKK